ncbi:MAG: hypothetical protein ABI333_26155 [bacterium]
MLLLPKLAAGSLTAAFVLLLLPSPSSAQCPPSVAPGSDVYSTLSQCQSWSCSVSYDPENGYFPQDDPIAPWIFDNPTDDATLAIVDNKLQVSRIPGTSGWLWSAFERFESALDDPGTWLYAVQVQVRITSFEAPLFPDTLFGAGIANGREVVFNFLYDGGVKEVVLGDPATASPQHR